MWHLKFQMIEPQKSYEAALISKQEENKKTPVDKKLERNV